MKKLTLEISLGSDQFAGITEETYRNEGLTVGTDHLRFLGEEIEMEVKFEDIKIEQKIGQV